MNFDRDLEEDLFYSLYRPFHHTNFVYDSDSDVESSPNKGHFSLETSLIVGHFSQGTSLIMGRRASQNSRSDVPNGNSSGRPRRFSTVDDDVPKNGQRPARNNFCKPDAGIRLRFVKAKAKGFNYELDFQKRVEFLLLQRQLPFNEGCETRISPKTHKECIYLNREDELIYRSFDLLYRLIWLTYFNNPYLVDDEYQPGEFEQYQFYILTIFTLKLTNYLRQRHDFRHSSDASEDIPHCDDLLIPLEMIHGLICVLRTLETLSTLMLEDICLALSFDSNISMRVQHVISMSPRIIFHKNSCEGQFFLGPYRRGEFCLFNVYTTEGKVVRAVCKYDEHSVLGRIRYSQQFMQLMSKWLKNLNDRYEFKDGFRSIGARSKTFLDEEEYSHLIELNVDKPRFAFTLWASAICQTQQMNFEPHDEMLKFEKIHQYHRKYVLEELCRDYRNVTAQIKLENTKPGRLSEEKRQMLKREEEYLTSDPEVNGAYDSDSSYVDTDDM